jgi:purine nucleosidase
MTRATTRVHLDTDLGGDIDDLCALALLLRWPGVEITGLTTVTDEGGRRAGYTAAALRLAGRAAIPLAAGADVADGHYRAIPTYSPEAEFWPAPVAPRPGPLAAALDLLEASIEGGATVIAIGHCTNLALLDRRRPGILRRAPIVLMGGYIFPPDPTRSAWRNQDDYNFQLDVASAHHVLTHCEPTLVPLHATVATSLRRADLPALEAAGPLGALLARQARAFDRAGLDGAADRERYPGLAPDFINFLHDPLACAVALGWPGAVVETVPLRVTVEDGWLHERVAPGGRPTRVVTRVDGPAFDAHWLATVTSTA